VVVTDRALVFFEATDTGPRYRMALRLPVASIASIEMGSDRMPGTSGPIAWVRRADAEAEAFAFTESESTHLDAWALDRGRTERFVGTVRRLRP
jgi:hypothetical protein